MKIQPPAAIPFTVGDVETQPGLPDRHGHALRILTLVPSGNIPWAAAVQIARSTSRLLPTRAAPPPSRSLSTMEMSRSSDTFLLTVSPVNDAPVADAQSVSMPWNTSMNIVLTGSDVEDSPLTFDIVDDPAHGSLSGSGANRHVHAHRRTTQGQTALPSRSMMGRQIARLPP